MSAGVVVVASACHAGASAQAGQPHSLAGLLSLPKACSEFTRRGERRVAGEEFRSACHTVVQR